MTTEIPDERWMPPSPHREEILKQIERGRCHIEERGHGVAPLLVFEDGGVIELPKVRYRNTRRGMQLAAAEEDAPEEQTRFSDVCGTLDELKGLLKEQPGLAKSDPARLIGLLNHAAYMIRRMQRRREHYRKFARDVADLCRRMADIEGPDPTEALQKLDAIRSFLAERPESVSGGIEELYALAEGVRDAANALEKCLAGNKEAAIEIGEAYETIKGGRTWKRNDKGSS
ncbi:MAG: hypothetical protein AB1696_09175 [Planctomycetota bacterium]